MILAPPPHFCSISPCPSHKWSNTQSPLQSQVVVISSTMNRIYESQTLESDVRIEQRKRRCDLLDMHKELVHYAKAWSWQKSKVKEKKTLMERNEDFSDAVIVLQHPPVYTLGTGSSEEYLNFDPNTSSYEVYRAERGGEVTYHGPGQLVVYPIINLRYHKMDLHWYLRALEEVVIRMLQSTFSIKASRLEGFTGVWVGDQKLAAIGIRVTQWIAYHGLALNVTTDLTPFQQIVPCGIRNRGVGSIKSLLGESLIRGGIVSMHDHDDGKLIDITYRSLMEEFAEVFQLELLRNINPNLEFSDVKP